MKPALLSLYHRAPYGIKVAAATAHGRRLRSWREGPEADRLVREALERDHWTGERWRLWEQDALERLLHRAVTHVPYYREHWSARRRRGDRASWRELSNWPVLTKEELRRAPKAFVADDCDPRSMLHQHTSGTTGKPLNLWWSRRAAHRWYALVEARVRRWNGLSRREPFAMLGGQLVTPFARRQPPYWVWNAALKQLYLSSYHLEPDNARHYFEAMRRYGVLYATGYPSSLHALAEFARERELEVPILKAALTNSEPLYAHQRASIGRAYGCPVRDMYGMAEIVVGASECAAGTLHAWPEVGHVEAMDADHDGQAAEGEAGRLVCTGLLNTDMPLVRYETGDRGSSPRTAACACGRLLPRMGAVDGRADDVLISPSGRRLASPDTALKASLPIREAQIVQEGPALLRVRLVPSAGYDASTEAEIREALRARVGEMEILVEPVEHIARFANGKFKVIVNQSGERAPVAS